MADTKSKFKYPGTRVALDGNTAAIMCERESSDAAGAYPITPSTQMGEYWAEEAAKGHLNVSDKPLIYPELYLLHMISENEKEFQKKLKQFDKKD